MILSAADLHFSYDDRSVLTEVALTLRSGAMLAVMGVNGAGKSSLLRCLNGILRPQLGVVLLDGRNLLAMPQGEIARCVAHVPQRSRETRLTVFEAVLLGRKPHIRWSPTPADYRRVETAIRQMGLEDLALRPVSELSGGEAQKVVIARALVQEPKVLLLDEPTSSLDLKNQLEVMGLVRSAVKDGNLAAAVCLHDLNLALRFADRLLFLKDRRVHALVRAEAVTAETVREVYGVEVLLVQAGGQRVVVPMGDPVGSKDGEGAFHGVPPEARGSERRRGPVWSDS